MDILIAITTGCIKNICTVQKALEDLNYQPSLSILLPTLVLWYIYKSFHFRVTEIFQYIFSLSSVLGPGCLAAGPGRKYYVTCFPFRLQFKVSNELTYVILLYTISLTAINYMIEKGVLSCSHLICKGFSKFYMLPKYCPKITAAMVSRKKTENFNCKSVIYVDKCGQFC